MAAKLRCEMRGAAKQVIKHRRHLFLVPCLLVLSACATGPSDRASRHERPYAHPGEDRAVGARGEFAQLAQELDERASRAHEVAERRSASLGRGEQELFARLHRFSDQAHLFHERVEAGQLSRGRLSGSLHQLRDEARDTDRSLRQAEVSPEARDEWHDVLRVLDRMVSLVRG
jgi:hypothetical protein